MDFNAVNQMMNKKNMQETLVSMGFATSYIGRAFKVFEKNYGHQYNIKTMTEIICRLQNKDKFTKQKNAQNGSLQPQSPAPLRFKPQSPAPLRLKHLTTTKTVNAKQIQRKNRMILSNSNHNNVYIPPFSPYITFEEANRLKINDKIDHRDQVGRFVYATIIEKIGTNLKIHYDCWSRKWDTWSDYNVEIHRFAYAGSVSKRPAHRFKQLQKGDYIDINPTHTHSEWKCGEIKRFDEKSGQIQVLYESLATNVMYWAHLDNINEIAEFTSKSGAVHSTQMKIMKQTQTQIQQHSKQEGKKDGKSKDNETDVENLNKIMQSATVDIEENRDNMNENSNNRQRKSRKRKRKFDEMNEIILSPSISVKRIKLMNSNNCIDHKKENETLKQENEALKQRLDLLQCRSEKIKAMNLNQLTESKTIMQNTIVNMQNKIKLIEETEKELMDNTYKCVACTDNMKNISFVDGCDHVALCHKCEQLAETKCCPICRKPYTNVKKINF